MKTHQRLAQARRAAFDRGLVYPLILHEGQAGARRESFASRPGAGVARTRLSPENAGPDFFFHRKTSEQLLMGRWRPGDRKQTADAFSRVGKINATFSPSTGSGNGIALGGPLRFLCSEHDACPRNRVASLHFLLEVASSSPQQAFLSCTSDLLGQS